MNNDKEKCETDVPQDLPDVEISNSDKPKVLDSNQLIIKTTHDSPLDNSCTIQETDDTKIDIIEKSSDNTSQGNVLQLPTVTSQEDSKVLSESNVPITDITQKKSDVQQNSTQSVTDSNQLILNKIKKESDTNETVNSEQRVSDTNQLPTDANQVLEKTVIAKQPMRNGMQSKSMPIIEGGTHEGAKILQGSLKKLSKTPKEKSSRNQNCSLSQIIANGKDIIYPLPENWLSPIRSLFDHFQPKAVALDPYEIQIKQLMQKDKSKSTSKPLDENPEQIQPIKLAVKVGEKRKHTELADSICQPLAKVLKRTEKAQAKKLAIAPVDYPATKMSKTQIILLQSTLLAAIDNIPNGEVCPRFLSCHRNKGSLEIACFDDATFKWLKKIINTVTISPEIKLKAVEPWILHKITRFVAQIPGPIMPPEKILVRLQHQNKNINTSEWVVKPCTEKDGGQTVVIPVKDDGVKALEGLRFEPFLNFSRVKFRKMKEHWGETL